jgi:TrmH family RNA methyltransferase
MNLTSKTVISNIDHPCVFQVKKLRKREFREKSGLVIVEGYPEAKRAARAGVLFKVIYVCPEIISLKPGEFPDEKIVEVTIDVFARMAYGTRLKGILTLCQPPVLSLKDLNLKQNSLVVVLENVEKPGNLGGIIRSSEGAGADCVIMCDGKTDIYNQHVVRSSMGTVFMLPTVTASKEETWAFLRKNNVRILAATSRGKKIYTDVDLTQSTAILVGTEHEGLSSFWLEHADEQIKIPMMGDGQCLNVNASASILIYEVHRQRNLK